MPNGSRRNDVSHTGSRPGSGPFSNLRQFLQTGIGGRDRAELPIRDVTSLFASVTCTANEDENVLPRRFLVHSQLRQRLTANLQDAFPKPNVHRRGLGNKLESNTKIAHLQDRSL